MGHTVPRSPTWTRTQAAAEGVAAAEAEGGRRRWWWKWWWSMCQCWGSLKVEVGELVGVAAAETAEEETDGGGGGGGRILRWRTGGGRPRWSGESGGRKSERLRETV